MSGSVPSATSNRREQAYAIPIWGRIVLGLLAGFAWLALLVSACVCFSLQLWSYEYNSLAGRNLWLFREDLQPDSHRDPRKCVRRSCIRFLVFG
jgi:hypothetical protein